jgi:putative hemolysin
MAALVTIEDLLEAIVGNIEDEHDNEAAEDAPRREAEGTWVVPGSFEVDRLRELFEQRDAADGVEFGRVEAEAAEEAEQVLSQLLSKYEATTVGGLVSEMTGHIPLPGEVAEDGPLRLEVVASSDRRVERVRAGMNRASSVGELE